MNGLGNKAGHFVYVLMYPNGTPFYVGMGTLRRAFGLHNRSVWFTRIYEKILLEGGEPQRLTLECESCEEAAELETKLIREYGRRDLGLGPLVNMTDGGEKGDRGRIVSEETRQLQHDIFRGRSFDQEIRDKMSESKIGNTNALGKTATSQRRDLVSKSMMGNTNRTGTVQSEETRRKIAEKSAEYHRRRRLGLPPEETQKQRRARKKQEAESIVRERHTMKEKRAERDIVAAQNKAESKS